MSTWFRSLVLFLVALIVQGQEPSKPQPTVEQLQAELKAKDARIMWLTDILKQTQAKLDALAAYFAADEALMRLQANPPAEAQAKQ